MVIKLLINGIVMVIINGKMVNYLSWLLLMDINGIMKHPIKNTSTNPMDDDWGVAIIKMAQVSVADRAGGRQPNLDGAAGVDVPTLIFNEQIL